MSYLFCPRCGTSYTDQSRKAEYLHCLNCEFDFYQNPKPCNGLIIENSQGEILLIKRKYDPDKGKWDVPGGFVDQQENLEQSAIREAKEELNAEIKDIHYLASYSDTYDFQSMTYPSLIFMLSASLKGSSLKAADDAEEIKFFPKNQIPWDNLAFNFLKPALEDYLGQQK
jgi:ADP-ribose pyrophosphatase YjhB (NUDIX family)